MSVRKRIILATVVVVLTIATLSFHQLLHTSPQALTVSFAGYTNLPSGDKVAVFSISNQWNVAIKRWAAAYFEYSPYLTNSSQAQWKMVGQLFQDAILRPGQTEQLKISGPPWTGDWRLRIPWSTNGGSTRSQTRASCALRIANLTVSRTLMFNPKDDPDHSARKKWR